MIFVRSMLKQVKYVETCSTSAVLHDHTAVLHDHTAVLQDQRPMIVDEVHVQK